MKILRELREKRGLTLEQVAEGVGLMKPAPISEGGFLI